MYEPPVTLSFKQKEVSCHCNEELDNIIVEYIHEVGIDVNKDELIKAMQYDRNQYDKGYQDGYEAAKLKYEKMLYTHDS